jgi:hypothetical protein
MGILRQVIFSITLIVALLAQNAILHAQSTSPGSPVTVRGKVITFQEPELSVTTSAGPVAVRLSPATTITGEAPARLADITPGVFVGASAQKQGDGTFRAAQINIFREEERGFSEGHRPQSSLPTHTMTNATVENIENLTVQDVSGRMLTLKFKEGEVKVFVPPDTPIMKRVTGSRDMLKPGAELRVQGSKEPDGRLSAQGIIVSTSSASPQK